ncbi:hypothetical protein ACWEOH_03890 [Agromyces sp. NPDC004153]
MSEDEQIVIEADGIPSAELHALVRSTGFEEVQIEADDYRAVDPGYVAAVITGIVAMAGPFIAKLADRLFEKAPRARIVLVSADGGQRIELDAELAGDLRDQLIQRAVAGTGLRVLIERNTH